MKFIVAITLSLGMAQPLLAQAEETEVMPCEAVGEIAYVIMSARQAGMIMSDVRARLLSEEAGVYSDMMEQFIFDAWEKPQFMTDEIKEREKKEFQNQKELACYKAYKLRDEG